MPVFEHRFEVTASVEEVAAFHVDPRAFRRLVPPGIILQIHVQEPVATDSVNEFTMWMGPLPVYWMAVHSDVSPSGFQDRQTAGPMKSWVHSHSFEPISEFQTTVVDHIEYEHHFGWRGVCSRLLFSGIGLWWVFAWRTWATRRAVRSM